MWTRAAPTTLLKAFVKQHFCKMYVGYVPFLSNFILRASKIILWIFLYVFVYNSIFWTSIGFIVFGLLRPVANLANHLRMAAFWYVWCTARKSVVKSLFVSADFFLPKIELHTRTRSSLFEIFLKYQNFRHWICCIEPTNCPKGPPK